MLTIGSILYVKEKEIPQATFRDDNKNSRQKKKKRKYPLHVRFFNPNYLINKR